MQSMLLFSLAKIVHHCVWTFPIFGLDVSFVLLHVVFYFYFYEGARSPNAHELCACSSRRPYEKHVAPGINKGRRLTLRIVSLCLCSPLRFGKVKAVHLTSKTTRCPIRNLGRRELGLGGKGNCSVQSTILSINQSNEQCINALMN